MKYYILLLFPLLLTSCNIVESLGTTGITILFVVLIAATIAMFFYAAKKRKEADNTASGFAANLRQMLEKISRSEDKIISLENTIKRINEDEKYKKDTVWRDKLLSKVYQKMAEVYFQMQDTDKVIEISTEIIRLEPRHVMSYYNRGTLYGNKEMYEEAEADLTEALTIDCTYSIIYNNRGMVYEKQGKYEKALQDYAYALGIEENTITYYNRGNTHSKMKNRELALADYEKAKELDPKDDLGIRYNIDKAIEDLNNIVI